MLRLRFLSAFVGVPILLFIAVMGGGLYVAAVVVAAVVGKIIGRVRAQHFLLATISEIRAQWETDPTNTKQALKCG